MGRSRLQSGFTHLALVLLFVLVAVIAFAGYKVVHNRSEKTQANTTSTAVTQTQLIKNNADLDKANQTLNSQPIDNDLDPNSYDSDVNSLL